MSTLVSEVEALQQTVFTCNNQSRIAYGQTSSLQHLEAICIFMVGSDAPVLDDILQIIIYTWQTGISQDWKMGHRTPLFILYGNYASLHANKCTSSLLVRLILRSRLGRRMLTPAFLNVFVTGARVHVLSSFTPIRQHAVNMLDLTDLPSLYLLVFVGCRDGDISPINVFTLQVSIYWGNS